MEPFHAHTERREAPPICRKGGVYRAATQEELDAAYQASFPDGPAPIATFRLGEPGDMARAKALLGPLAFDNHRRSDGSFDWASFFAVIARDSE